MTFNKETRQELTEQEIREDVIRETSNEIDDGALDTYIDENFEELSKEFCLNSFNDEFRDFAKGQYNEVNNEI